MAVTVTMRKVTLEAAPSGRLLCEFSDGSGFEFNSLADAKAQVAQLDSGATGQNQAQMLLLAWWLARQPDGSNTQLVEGKSLTFDLAAAQPIRVA